MFILTAKNRESTKWDDLCVFYDENQFHYMCDSVDKNIYSEVMITDDSGTRCLFYYGFKDFTPYFKKHKIKKRS